MSLSKRFNAVLRLYPYIWPKDWGIRTRLIIAIFLLFTTMALNVGVPLVLRQVINVISIQPGPLLLGEALLIAYGLVWTVSKITDQLRLVAMNRVVERGIRLLCLNVFDHLMRLSLRFHSDRKTGAILSSIDRAQFAFPGFVWGLFFLILPTLIEVIVTAMILTYLFGYIYGVILAVILLAYMLFSIYGSLWSMAAQRIANEKSAQATTNIVDSLLNYETVRYFGNQQYEHDRCDRLLAERENSTTKQHLRGEMVLLVQGIIMGIGLIILTWLSGTQVMAGALRISDFVLINVYLLQFMVPLGNFGYVFRDMNEGLTNLEDVMNILDETSEIEDRTNATHLSLKEGSIVFRNVNFGYDTRRSILHDVSFEIPAKKTVAIVGPTGSGKSTIAKLLFRYYDVSNGEILIDGRDIREITQTSLQSLIGVVPQHTALFNDTLHYNIAYGDPDASLVDIQNVIKRSHLDLFVSSLPDGLNTIVGEHGLKLSGGERQRVAIARVLLKNPPILVFDEATSSLDTKTEQLIQKNIEEVSRNATTLIIAHRLSTIVHADQILVLENGRIIEKGTHSELLKQGGLYFQLWEKQTHEKSKNVDS